MRLLKWSSLVSGGLIVVACYGGGGNNNDSGGGCIDLSGTWSVEDTCFTSQCTVSQTGCTFQMSCDDGESYSGSVSGTSVSFNSGQTNCSGVLSDLEPGEEPDADGTCDTDGTTCDFQAECKAGKCLQAGNMGSGGSTSHGGSSSSGGSSAGSFSDGGTVVADGGTLSAGGSSAGSFSAGGTAAGGTAGGGSCLDGDPPSCVDAQTVEVCVEGEYTSYDCSTICTQYGFEPGACSGINCACGEATDETCALGAAAVCACSSEACTNEDISALYVACYIDDPQADFVSCFADWVSNDMVDCDSAATYCL